MPEFGWDQYDLGKEMRGMTISQLIDRYKQEDATYKDACVRSLDLRKTLSEQEKRDAIADCERLDLNRVKVALEIADTLAGTKNN